MKPLLILLPSATRWPSLAALLEHEPTAVRADLQARLEQGTVGARDAVAALPDGSLFLSAGCIRRRGAVGVLGQVFTRPEHRRRGYCRGVLQALLSWFDMSGGKWLYLTTPADAAGFLFENFGFRVLHRGQRDGRPHVTMLRTPAHGHPTPFDLCDDRTTIRTATRADWPLLVALLQHRPGPDPRVPIDESAIAAETTITELIHQAESGLCKLLVAVCKGVVVGLGTLATDREGHRSYAMVLPFDKPPEGLRAALLEAARQQGYDQIDFPMQALAGAAPAQENTAPTQEGATPTEPGV